MDPGLPGTGPTTTSDQYDFKLEFKKPLLSQAKPKQPPTELFHIVQQQSGFNTFSQIISSSLSQIPAISDPIPFFAMTVSAPVTPATKIRTTPSSTPGGPRIREEKILVTVRIRPLTPRELANYDLFAWDCTDENTLASTNLNHDRHNSTYTFDRVFDPSCPNRTIYEQGARDVALSAIKGINATIFAYGQTSSGKTYTMKGIAENCINDIYSHISNATASRFVLKFSAIEIYNETVVDLLNPDSGSLRLLDDPEKGTVVEKLTEEIITNSQHLRSLIATCEDQRQVGETSLNNRSSRSHQIIRLTIASNLRDDSGCEKSLLASLSLVDLAGSERAAQTNAGGARLKEGSHINRSLLTLTNVIRKLSGGKKTGHIPYRDSKLTRILQASLGGNARTAIICTMSPALSHVDQSRNTLAFATSAKEVTNTAQVNMVVAEKQLVKHLQKEVNRLKAELLSPEPSSSSECLRSLLVEKEQRIHQMEKEMDELKRQRDFAQSQLEVARKLQDDARPSFQAAKRLSFSSENVSTVSGSKRKTQIRRRQSIEPCMLVHEIRKIEMIQRRLGEEADRTLELLSSQRLANHESIERLVSDIKTINASLKDDNGVKEGGGGGGGGGGGSGSGSLKEEIDKLRCEQVASLEEKLELVQKSLDRLISGEEGGVDSRTPLKNKKKNNNNISSGTSMPNFIRSPCLPGLHGLENRDPETYNSAAGVGDQTPNKATTAGADESKKSTPKSASKQPQSSVSVKKIQMMFKTAAEDNIQSIKTYVTDLKERVAKLQYQKQLLVCQVLELEEGSDDKVGGESPMPRHLVFEDHRKQIIMLWHLCHVSIIHRTQFYMLFRGEPADDIYVQVELRRLTWLEQQLADLGNASPALLGDEPAGYVTSCIKALKQEREYLAKRVNTKLSVEEREMLYRRWDIPMEGGKQKRRQQLVNQLWTDPLNESHVKESAEIVAKLVGFCESGSKEMFALNFVNPSDKKSWMGGWNLISNLLHL